MGIHGGVNSRPRARRVNGRSKTSQSFTLQNSPVSWRLSGVIILTLALGLTFGGLRVAAAAENATQFNRVEQLANLGEQVTVLVQDVENERDVTSGSPDSTDPQALQPLYKATDAQAAKVQVLAAGIGGSFPANVQEKVQAMRSAIDGLDKTRVNAQFDTFTLEVIDTYQIPIDDMISLIDLIPQGSNDAELNSDVQTLNSLILEKDELSQQRALLFNALTAGTFAIAEQQQLSTAAALQGADEAAFDTAATTSETDAFNHITAASQVIEADSIEQDVLNTGSLNLASLRISPQAAPGAWYSSVSDTLAQTQTIELTVANSIVARAQVLRSGAEQSALFIGILLAVILLLVLAATFAVVRSLVLPLRRLQAGALNIATVQLPERVRRMGESPEAATSLEVAPIDVLSADEIGQVARAFDQVHTEAVRLAGNEALLRGSFNAMFVSLSRRSQSLIERLTRTIDSLEQNEEDPSRLANLFTMDHLVTRMRRNSENLLLLAGHESPRKWSDPVPLTDVTRAATSEIEQYNRVALNVQPGIMVAGPAVSDIVHLLAEIIENATVFSPKETQVLVAAQELTSGGVLIQVSDSGVGISEARLIEMNYRLDNPPVIDASVSRHMGLFAVGRLAERHGVRVRLRAGNPQGVSAMVWLPDSIVERGTPSYEGLPRVGATQARRTPDRQANARTNAANPASNWFRNRRAGAKPDKELSVPGGWAQGQQAAQLIANPVRADRTVAGMPVRVPSANFVPGSADGGENVASQSADDREASTPGVQRQRTPEMARSRLGGFQSGTRRAEGQPPNARGGTNR